MRIGVYPGTFDPITNGHVDLINRGLRLFDKIYVAVAANPQKHPVLALDERVELVRLATKETPRVEVEPFHGLLVDFVRQRGAHAVIRTSTRRCRSRKRASLPSAAASRNTPPRVASTNSSWRSSRSSGATRVSPTTRRRC